ncbi:MAG: DUF424 domain-containing protein [Desulfurococcales archaeon]|nr:DUF424 domain-containing protein [Desulfurococcales archaeon]
MRIMKGREVYVKVMEVDDVAGVRMVVAVCDKELLGKKFSEGEVILDVNKDFFGGFLTDIDEALHYVENAFTAMLVGENIVQEAIKAGLIHPEAVLKVSGVPYAHIVRL